MMSAFRFAMLLVVLDCAQLAAQSEAPPIFVDGTAFADLERLSHSDVQAPTSFRQNLSGTVAGGSVAVGTFLGPRVSLRLEVAVSGRLDETFMPPPQTFGSTLALDGVVTVLQTSQRVSASKSTRAVHTN